MKEGDKITCPLCGEETFVKSESMLDGWTVKGKILKCAICGGKLADESDEPEEAVEEKKSAGLSALANFLDTEVEEAPSHNISQDVRRFCKDCANFIEHPFRTRCGLWDKEVDPMDDCEQFTPKTTEKNERNIL